MTRFQRWAAATTAATYLLIAIGGLVRASGAGLGCPDWPKCFDRWIPPTDVRDVPSHIDPALFNVAKAWTEYINRLIGVVIGLLIFVTLVLAIRHHRRDPRILWTTLAAFLLVGFEGWLGGQVVAAQLAPLVLSAHLAVALIIGGLLLYATACAFLDGGRPRTDLPPWRRPLGQATLVVSILALAQVALGAIIRGEVQLLGKQSPPVPREEWLGRVGAIYSAHSSSAVLLTAITCALVWWVLERARGDAALRKTAWAVLGLTLAQPATGLGLAWLDVHPVFQVLHLWLGSLLVSALMLQAIVAFRAPPPASVPTTG